jgi:tetratricopeptide (TPR) repeat protein
LKEQGDANAAIEDFSRALKLNPNFGLAYFGRAEALANRGERGAAIRDYERWSAAAATRRDGARSRCRCRN